MTKAIPEGYHSVTPTIVFKNARKAIDFYSKAFDAKTLGLFPTMDGKGVMHATIQIGNSIIMVSDEIPGQSCQSAETLGASPVNLYIYTEDVDAFVKKATQAGATVSMPVADMFWGDRAGQVKDPFGYAWMIATHKKDLTSDQIRKGAEAFFSQMAGK